MFELKEQDVLFEKNTEKITRNDFVVQKAQVDYYMFTKRIMDVVLSIVGLVLSLPVFVLISIIIKLDSPGPIFYFQERVGHKGKNFRIIKFRSMNTDAEKAGAQWALNNDPRVTRIGNFIRKTRIDELPQLINVLKGEMSLIGPRPERPIFTIQFNKEIPGFVHRLEIKPGVTGWAQVNGGYNITPKEKLQLDLFYIKKMSFWLDIRILMRTVKVVITGDGAR